MPLRAERKMGHHKGELKASSLRGNRCLLGIRRKGPVDRRRIQTTEGKENRTKESARTKMFVRRNKVAQVGGGGWE